MHKISDNTKQQAVVLRQQGLTYAEISKQLGISVVWCKKNLGSIVITHIGSNGMRKLKDEVRDHAVKLRQEGSTYLQIAGQLGISVDWCKKNLKLTETEWVKSEWIEFLEKFPANGNNCVYCFLSNDIYIYVGSSQQLQQRIYKHRRDSDFFKEAKSIVVEVYSTASEMLFNEAQHIAKHKPPYNTRHIYSGVSGTVIEPVQTITIPIPQTIKLKEIELQHDKTN